MRAVYTFDDFIKPGRHSLLVIHVNELVADEDLGGCGDGTFDENSEVALQHKRSRFSRNYERDAQKLQTLALQ